MQALGFDYSEAQMEAIFKEVDADGSGVIEIN
jgi:Ca2+-binding EF-hand superfamily protein